MAVRSSAAGEDSRKKAFAGLQDTFLNMVGDDAVATAYLWDCASAYNLRSMIYRREAILDALTQSETTGQEELAAQAKKEWSIENTSLSVCIMRMINPVVSGTGVQRRHRHGLPRDRPQGPREHRHQLRPR